MKIRFIAFIVAVLSIADFAFAQTYTQTQSQVGGGISISSGSYDMKGAVGDAGVGVTVSESANYIYDHGTIWEGTSTASEEPIGGSGPGGSGSGWDEWWDIEDPDLGISALTPTKNPTAVEVVKAVKAVAPATIGAVPEAQFVPTLKKALVKPTFVPQVIATVNAEKNVKEIAIVLTRRVIPWPLWIALVLAVLGIISLVLFGIGRGREARYLWAAGALIVLAIIIALVTRSVYRARYASEEFGTITDSIVVSGTEAGDAVKRVMEELSLGSHQITVTGTSLAPELVITIYVRQALPI